VALLALQTYYRNNESHPAANFDLSPKLKKQLTTLAIRHDLSQMHGNVLDTAVKMDVCHAGGTDVATGASIATCPLLSLLLTPQQRTIGMAVYLTCKSCIENAKYARELGIHTGPHDGGTAGSPPTIILDSGDEDDALCNALSDVESGANEQPLPVATTEDEALSHALSVVESGATESSAAEQQQPPAEVSAPPPTEPNSVARSAPCNEWEYIKGFPYTASDKVKMQRAVTDLATMQAAVALTPSVRQLLSVTPEKIMIEEHLEIVQEHNEVDATFTTQIKWNPLQPFHRHYADCRHCCCKSCTGCNTTKWTTCCKQCSKCNPIQQAQKQPTASLRDGTLSTKTSLTTNVTSSQQQRQQTVKRDEHTPTLDKSPLAEPQSHPLAQKAQIQAEAPLELAHDGEPSQLALKAKNAAAASKSLASDLPPSPLQQQQQQHPLQQAGPLQMATRDDLAVPVGETSEQTPQEKPLQQAATDSSAVPPSPLRQIQHPLQQAGPSQVPQGGNLAVSPGVKSAPLPQQQPLKHAATASKFSVGDNVTVTVPNTKALTNAKAIIHEIDLSHSGHRFVRVKLSMAVDGRTVIKVRESNVRHDLSQLEPDVPRTPVKSSRQTRSSAQPSRPPAKRARFHRGRAGAVDRASVCFHGQLPRRSSARGGIVTHSALLVPFIHAVAQEISSITNEIPVDNKFKFNYTEFPIRTSKSPQEFDALKHLYALHFIAIKVTRTDLYSYCDSKGYIGGVLQLRLTDPLHPLTLIAGLPQDFCDRLARLSFP
jgi:hypothetical protein